jgi:hypothetical protein
MRPRVSSTDADHVLESGQSTDVALERHCLDIWKRHSAASRGWAMIWAR